MVFSLVIEITIGVQFQKPVFLLLIRSNVNEGTSVFENSVFTA